MEISSSLRAAQFLRKYVSTAEVEEFWAIALNSLCQPIKVQMLNRGTVDSCAVHPRDVYRFAVLQNATFLIIGHNHPSGSCLPSQDDINLSLNLRKIGKLLQIALLDHVIITQISHFSFADHGWGNFLKQNFTAQTPKLNLDPR